MLSAFSEAFLKDHGTDEGRHGPPPRVGFATGSSAQIALFVAPVLVLLSWVIGPAPMEGRRHPERRRRGLHRADQDLADRGQQHLIFWPWEVVMSKGLAVWIYVDHYGSL